MVHHARRAAHVAQDDDRDGVGRAFPFKSGEEDKTEVCYAGQSSCSRHQRCERSIIMHR
jgi:hypothetical protein